MSLVRSLQRAIDYMEEHLLDDITAKDVAKQAHMSPYHFQRTFSILTDITIGEYLRRRRLTKAAQELCNTDTKIIDLSYKYGYKTPESFAKAFQKQHGVSPSDARKGLGNLQSYNRLTIQVSVKGAQPMNYQLMERDAFQIVGVRAQLACGEDFDQAKEIGLFWDRVGREGTIERLLGLNDGLTQGLIGATVDYSEERNEIEYWIGVESTASTPGNTVDGLLSYEVPAAKWAVFEVIGPVAKVLPETWRKIHSEWFPSNDYAHGDGPNLEVYQSPDPTSPTAKTEIWVPIKMPIK